MEFGYCPNCIAIQLLHCRQLGRLGRTDVGAGRTGCWARRALGAQGAGRAGQAGAGRRASGRWVSGRRALVRVTCRRAAGGQKRGACGRGARHERQARGLRAATRPRGCCDTAPVRAVHAAMHGLGTPGALAGPVGGSCSQFGFLTWAFDSVVFLSRRLDSVHEHCSYTLFITTFFPKKKYFKFN